MNHAEKIKKFIKNTQIKTDPETNRKVLDELVTELKTTQTSVPAYQPGIWRTIMNKRITKFAAAAMIMAAVLVGMNLMTNTGSIALADVLEKVMKINSFAYKIRTTNALDASDYTEFDMLLSGEHGAMRVIAYTNDSVGDQIPQKAINYMYPSEGYMLTVVPKDKVYIRIELTGSLLEEMKNEKKNDPRLILADFVENPYIELGRDTIDGVAVVGFESSGLPSTDGSASSLSRLWVDVQTELPVLSEANTIW